MSRGRLGPERGDMLVTFYNVALGIRLAPRAVVLCVAGTAGT